MAPQIIPKALLFDLGDVLFTWSPETKTAIPPRMMGEIISSDPWREFERGRLTQEACYKVVADQFSIPLSEVHSAFVQARDSLTPNDDMVTFIKQLRATYGASLKLYAMSNISKEDWSFLSTRLPDWSIFDRVFTSGHAGMRKPDLSFYHHVLEETSLKADEAVFVDDKTENVLAARSLGIRSIVFDDSFKVIRTLADIFGDPILRAKVFLERNARQLHSITADGTAVRDNFAEMLILEATGDRDLVSLEWGSKKTWNFFNGPPTLIPGGYFPNDLDTTSLALQVLDPCAELCESILDEMTEYINDDGTIQTYFDRRKLRVDPVVSANVLGCFYRYARGQHMERTLSHVRDVLSEHAYLDGTRYYSSADCCLFFFARLLQSSSDELLHETLHSLLLQRTGERLGQPGTALDLAMRVLACDMLGLECSADRRSLAKLQYKDGGWDASPLYRYGSTGLNLGNRGVTTAFAMKALAC